MASDVHVLSLKLNSVVDYLLGLYFFEVFILILA